MVTIASKTTKEYPSLYLGLSSTIPKLIEKFLHSNGKELWMIQALLLLCCWPLPFGPKSADPSLSYSGLATSSALEIGLHRYKFPSDFKYDEPYDEGTAFMQKKTWLACFIVSQHTELGVPTCFHIDRTIINALETSDTRMPGVLKDQLRTTYLGFRISHSLGNDISSLSGLPSNRTSLIHLFETDLATARTGTSADRDASGEICFLAVKLQLYSYAFENNSSEEKEGADDGNRCEIFLRAYNAAMELVQIAVTNSSEAPYWTRQVYQSVINAMTFLLKLCSSSAPQLSAMDSPSTRNLISQGWGLLRSGSLMENDHLFRISNLVAYLSKLEEKDPQLPRLTVQSRMSANVMYDAVWRAKLRFSPEVRNMRPADYTATAVLEELSASWAENVLGEDGLFRHWNSVITNY
ncbi:Putative transcription factor SEF1 [Talaromyces islandicus]|uniref:Putative transcription factor SEF1 n=1 Tax=Talaromyces islandicus TaxID=28573 RepID=A0A0U1LYQ0_TALIS|nr:Putative transcription factor SEF1 [Talaromyces islandicus]